MKLKDIIKQRIVEQDDVDFPINSPTDGISKSDTNKIEIECSAGATEQLVPLLLQLYYMGSMGSSRGIEIKDWDGPNKFGFDGDGASRIGSLKVNGEKIKPK